MKRSRMTDLAAFKTALAAFNASLRGLPNGSGTCAIVVRFVLATPLGGDLVERT
jgi:hypothetical protein